MRFKSVIILILLLTLAFTACSDSGSDGDTTATTAADNGEVISETTTKAKELPDLPEITFDGETLNILTWAQSETLVQNDILAFELNGEPLNDAVYNRNVTIEERYDMKINPIETLIYDFRDLSRRVIMSGEKTYDVLNGGIDFTNMLAQSELLVNLHDVPYLDLSKSWWDQRCTEDLSIKGKIFLSMGDINTMDNSQTWGVIFNKQLAEDYGLANMYELVRNGQWTIDIAAEMGKQVIDDLNGDGVMNENDRWGDLSENFNFFMHYLGSGEAAFKKDADDYPYPTLDNPRAFEVMDKVYDYMNSPSVFIAQAWGHLASSSVWLEYIIPMFINNQGLYYITGIGNTFKHLRDMECDFGLLPIPKYDEVQDSYYNSINLYWTSCIAVPVTNDKLEMTGVILEALAAESVDTVTEAYYDIIFLNKAVRDNDSIEMVDLILQTRKFDIGYLNDWGGMRIMFESFLKSSDKNFASIYASNESAINTAFEKGMAIYAD